LALQPNWTPDYEPALVSTQVALAKGATTADVERPIRELINSELADIQSFTAKLARGEMHVC
jgi:S-adenosylmethionine synthetase